jgi:hypothetical protein
MLEQCQITGECQHQIFHKDGDPCFGCGFCTVDGNDYSAMSKEQKPCKLK